MVQSFTEKTPFIHKSNDKFLRQVACICYRKKKNRLKILLVTSRGRNRWIIPKGWLMALKTPLQTIEAEVWEEAGLTGKIFPKPIGKIKYKKLAPNANNLDVKASVYLMAVKEIYSIYPEVNERKRKWFSIKKAIKHTSEDGLDALFLKLKELKHRNTLSF